MRLAAKRAWVLSTGLLLTALLLWSMASADLNRLREPVDFARTTYVGSAVCEDCHRDRHASWQQTYHRTMTQAVTASAVRGQFDGAELRAFGGQVRPVQQGSEYAFEYSDPADNQLLARLPVERLVGSHRYQQYLTRDRDSQTYYRLHYLWHIEDRRWVHMNAAFLGDDAQAFDAQVSTWNMNCVFCHNTGPVPKVNNLAALRERARRGEALDMRAELRFDTEVAELGIGCEACHGPGAEHLRRMQTQTTRWVARRNPAVDTSIVNPKRLTAARANDICAACHAGRTLANVAALDEWFNQGPSFRPGDDLSKHLLVLNANTPSPSAHVPDLFRNRFWRDGSVRLTAYEYQGLKASACASDPELTCIRCHSMHGGDPAGMLPEANRGDAPCLRCHQDFRDKIAEHSGHPVDSIGARCMSCHMPRAVYGVMTIHRSHEISIPQVNGDLAAGKPNACLNCHANEAPDFAGSADPAAALTAVRQDGGDATLADGLVALLAGDPVRQAVAAFELGRVEQVRGDDDLLPRVPWLIEALADDRPAIRRFAWQSLKAIDQHLATSPRVLALQASLLAFDYTGERSVRDQAVQGVADAFARRDKSDWPKPSAASALDVHYQLDPQVRARLRELGLRSDKQIDIGE